MKILNDLKDNSVNEELLSTCHLFLFYSSNNIKFVVYHPDRKRIISFKEVDLEKSLNDISSIELKRNFSESELTYAQKTLIYASPKHTLVPKDVYKDSLKKEYYKLNYDLNDKEELRKDLVEAFKTFNIYTYDNNINKITNAFNTSNLKHSSSIFLTGVKKAGNLALKESIYVNIERSFIHILCFQFDRLILMNSFYTKTDEDILYHILNTAKVFSVNPDKSNFFFSGNIDETSSLFDLVFKYIRNPDFLNLPTSVKIDSNISTLTIHKYFIPFIAVLCE